MASKGKRATRPPSNPKRQAWVFDLPPKHSGGREKRQLELREVSREFRTSMLLGSLGATDGDVMSAVNTTVSECLKASIVRLGNDRVTNERSGEVLYYQLTEREMISARRNFDKLHKPSGDEKAELFASGVYDNGTWTFRVPVEHGQPTHDIVDKTPLTRELVLRELEVSQTEIIGRDVLRNNSQSHGLGLLEKDSLLDTSFVSLEGAPKLGEMSLRTWRFVEAAYVYAHRPNETELDLASGSMRPA